MKFLRLWLLIFISFGLLWLGGLLWFQTQIPAVQMVESHKTDAIIVPTGGMLRTRRGINLLRNGVAEKLFVSGAGEKVQVHELLLSNGYTEKDVAMLAERIELGHSAVNTYENAAEAAHWMLQNNYDSLHLVTSNYHMPRTLLEFRQAMKQVKIVPYAVFPPHVKLQSWWRYPGTRSLIISEYNKYLAVAIRTSPRWGRE